MSDHASSLPASPGVDSQVPWWVDVLMQAGHRAAVLGLFALGLLPVLPVPQDWRRPVLLLAAFVLSLLAALVPVCLMLLVRLPRGLLRECVGLLIFGGLLLATSALLVRYWPHP